MSRDSKVNQIGDFLQQHPGSSAVAVSKATGIARTTVYVLLSLNFEKHRNPQLGYVKCPIFIFTLKGRQLPRRKVM